jgi:type IV secretory pathway TrbD component
VAKVHQAGVRPQLWAGGEFWLAYPLPLLCLAGAEAFHFRWWACVGAFTIWRMGAHKLRKMAQADPLYCVVYSRELRMPWLFVPRGTIKELSRPPEDILPSQLWETWNLYELTSSAASWVARRLSRH